MRVKVLVEFEVTKDPGYDWEEGEEIESRHAADAAEQAMFHNLVLTENGQDIIAEAGVKQHVDGFGMCIVHLPGDER